MELQLDQLSHVEKQLLCTEIWRILILIEAFEGCGFSQLRKTYWKYEEKVVFKLGFETISS